MELMNTTPGSTAAIQCPGYVHYGKTLGPDQILHSSKRFGKVRIDTLAVFADGHDVKITPPKDPVDLSQLWQKANAIVGKPYNLLLSNCEQVKHYMEGKRPHSKQLWGGGIGLGAGFLLSKKAGCSNMQAATIGLLFGVAGIVIANALND